MQGNQHSNQPFSFAEHQQNAIERYRTKRHVYEAFVVVIRNILTEALRREGIQIASIEGRAKSEESFGRKSIIPAADDPDLPKYSDPMADIKDMAGIRVITFFPKSVTAVGDLIAREFIVHEASDKSTILEREERFGYQSVHYLVSLRKERLALPEYGRYDALCAEIQVRTILQHAWAEIEHDIQYKSLETAPTSIRRRFMALAGLLEIADREFQAIQDEDKELTESARASVVQGRFEDVEITPDALKAYLDRRLGQDRRVGSFSYDWCARMLIRLGFENFRQVDECIAGYNDDRLCRIVTGTRQGQITRFEILLLAGMGNEYIRRHPYSHLDWWHPSQQARLDRLTRAGIRIGNFVPR